MCGDGSHEIYTTHSDFFYSFYLYFENNRWLTVFLSVYYLSISSSSSSHAGFGLANSSRDLAFFRFYNITDQQ